MSLYDPVPDGRYTDGFGPRGWVPDVGDMGFHTGQDKAAPAGTPIVAVHDGVVIRKWWDAFVNGDGAGGWMLAIAGDDGLESRYAHKLEESPLPVGTRVVGGLSTIGAVGSSGAANGAHLHLEILQNGEFVDPRPLITKGRYMSLTQTEKNQLAAAAKQSTAAAKDSKYTAREIQRVYEVVQRPTKRTVNGKQITYSQSQNATDTNSLARELVVQEHVTRAQLDAICLQLGIDNEKVKRVGVIAGLTRLKSLLNNRASTPPKK